MQSSIAVKLLCALLIVELLLAFLLAVVPSSPSGSKAADFALLFFPDDFLKVCAGGKGGRC
jgi:hypothetical protein